MLPNQHPRSFVESVWPPLFTSGQPQARWFHDRLFLVLRQDRWRTILDQDAEAAENDSEDENEATEGDEIEALGNEDEDDEITGTDVAVELTTEEPDETLEETGLSIADTFMRDAKEGDKGQGNTVIGFCGDVTGEELREDHTASMLLYERSGTGELQQHIGALNSCQYCLKIGAELFVAEGTGEEGGESGITRQPLRWRSHTAQRETYLHNCSPHNAVALMATTSHFEAQPLRDLLSQHLAGGAEIGAHIPILGFRHFTLKAFIPYCTLEENPVYDSRPASRARGDALRVPSQLPQVGKQIMHMHRAQASFVLIGFDDYNWGAIYLVNSSDSNESVAFYERLWTGSDIVPDPMLRGESTFEFPTTTNPRLRFLCVWQVRVNRVSAITKSDSNLLKEIGEHMINELSGNEGTQLKAALGKIRQYIGQLRLWRECMKENLNAWNQFYETDIRYFRDYNGLCPRDAEMMRELLYSIKRTYSHIERTSLRVEHIREQLEKFHEGYRNINENDTLALRNAEATKQAQDLHRMQVDLLHGQRLANEGLQRIQYIGMMFLPLMSVCSLFSMQPTTLPFAQNFSAFGCSLLLVLTVTLVLVTEPIWRRVVSVSKATADRWGGLWVGLGAFGRSREQQTDSESLPGP